MNNLHQSEKHLAEKLNQAPLPDVKRTWPQMRSLLDKEMPEGGIVSGGNKKLLWLALAAGILLIAVWSSYQLNLKVPANKTANKSENNKVNKNSSDNKNSTVNKNQQSVALNKNQVNNSSEEISNNNNSSSEIKIITNEKSGNKKENLVQSNNGRENEDAQQDKIVNEKDRYGKVIKTHKKSNYNNHLKVVRPDQRNSNQKINSDQTETDDADEQNALTENNEKNDARFQIHTAKSRTFELPTLLIRDETDPGELFSTPDSKTLLIAELGKTDRAFVKAMRRKMMKEDRRRMSGKSIRGIFGPGEQHEITFAAGLSLPQSFAVGSQQFSSYGPSGGSGRFPDYLPAPFFQYYLNNHIFLQAEFHFQSPQYVNRLLISQKETEYPSGGMMIQKNIYLEKLYYFHIPLNVYFSPLPNLYLGSGLQYSSLLSGVASYEERRYVNSSFESSSSKVQRFKDDSIAAKLAPSEWRYQLDASYYYKRFTLGLRFNQAMKDYINLQVNNFLPAQARNKSFLLYLRFNIWEERKKTND